MSFYAALYLILVASALLMVGMALAYHLPRLAKYRIRHETFRKLRGPKMIKNVALNSLVSGTLVIFFTHVTTGLLVHHHDTSPWRMGLDVVLVLGLYDFLYYLTHRYPFHEWPVLKAVHAVHHTAKYPRALDSLYLHPIEMTIGVTLLMVCTAIVGPVHEHAFIGVFAVWSFLNILIHGGLSLPFFPFRAISYMARKHDRHHVSMKGGNYASITPVFDWLFGTAE